MVSIQGNYVQFRFFRPQARNVFVVGDFNGWREGDLRMVSSGGHWTAVVRLPAGSYRFRYRADGQWFTDFAAFGIEYTALGIDSIVHVSGSPAGDAELPEVAVALNGRAGSAKDRPHKAVEPAASAEHARPARAARAAEMIGA